MNYRKLRIAWSVACGILCLLLVVLWVRSYTCRDGCTLASRLYLDSYYGRIEYHLLLPPYSQEHDWFYFCDSPQLDFAKNPLLEFRLQSGPNRSGRVPHWFPLLLSAALAVAPWIRQLNLRFSLRTLLIAMTLVAIVLGLVIWAAR
jgi:hypothetical protein